jgi:hypothetical protein
MLSEVNRLFEEQLASWPALARGTEALQQARTKQVDVNGYTVLVRHLPHRIASTTAAVDRESLARRPCFLCAGNLPPEEIGLRFNEELTIYANPFPILDRHLTIAHRDHRPQRIAGQIDNMCALAEALPDYLVSYNGPQSGASAPDHLHFQACAISGVPVQGDVRRVQNGVIPDYARNALVFDDVAELKRAIGDGKPEPMLNLAMFRTAGTLNAVLFPRKKHRPSVFYSGQFTVSPATIDLCGVFVTPVESDFERISGEDIRRIYEEVTQDSLVGGSS